MASRAIGAENGKLAVAVFNEGAEEKVIWLDDPREAFCAAMTALNPGRTFKPYPTSRAIRFANSRLRAE
jgi:hypothetical protein